MAIYNIYAYLSGEQTDSPNYSIDCDCQEDADECAWESAIECYESYSGMHGIPDRETVAREYYHQQGAIQDPEDEEGYHEVYDVEDDDEIDDAYNEAVNSYITYYAVLASEDKNGEEDEDV